MLPRLQRRWVYYTATANSGGVMTFSDWVSSNSAITNLGGKLYISDLTPKLVPHVKLVVPEKVNFFKSISRLYSKFRLAHIQTD
jgi:hypothetical protein